MLDNRVPAFHLMAKPAGSRCNCACEYSFYLAKADLYPGRTLSMSDKVHRAYIEQLFASHRVPRVTVAYAQCTLGRACFSAHPATNPFSIKHTRPFA